MGKQQIFEEIKRQIDSRKENGKPFVIGINGIETSGKSEFTSRLNKFLIDNHYHTQIIHIDNFHNPKIVRNAGKNHIDNYYNSSFNITKIIETLLIPIQRHRKFKTKLTLHNYETDKYDTEEEYTFTENTIVLFEGVFLFRKELRDFIDYKIFIYIPVNELKKRAIVRDVPKLGDEVMKKYDIKYIPAQERYLNEHPPETIADLIIDNTDWNLPTIKYVNHN